MAKYQKYESNIYALRFMLNKACFLATQGTSQSSREVKEELATELEDLEKMLEIEIKELFKEK
ncbi:MAG: hypothetical protein ACJAW3_001323 [Lentimonas sp.]|jgi:hypothetical protein